MFKTFSELFSYLINKKIIDYQDVERYILCFDRKVKELVFLKFEKEKEYDVSSQVASPIDDISDDFSELYTQISNFRQEPTITKIANEESTDIMGSTDDVSTNFLKSSSQELFSAKIAYLDVPNISARLYPRNLNQAVEHITKIGDFKLTGKNPGDNNVPLYIRTTQSKTTILANVCNDMSKHDDIGFVQAGNLGPEELIAAVSECYKNLENNTKCQVIFPMAFSLLGHYMVIEIEISRTNNHSKPEIQMNIHDSMSGLSGVLFKFAVQHCSSAVSTFITELKSKFQVEDVTLNVINDSKQLDSHNCGRHAIHKLLSLSELLIHQETHREDILIIGEYLKQKNISPDMFSYLSNTVKGIEEFKHHHIGQTKTDNSSHSSPVIPFTNSQNTGFAAKEAEKRKSADNISSPTI